MFRNKYLTSVLPLSVFIIVAAACSEVKESTSLIDRNRKLKKLKLQPGFHAEHLYSPTENGKGSWVSMTFDNKGRLIGSDQYGALYRMELPPIGSDSIKSKVKIEKLDFNIGKANGSNVARSKVEMGYAQGMVWAFNSLYVVVNHKTDTAFDKGSGFYRLQDTNNDDQFDKITLLKSFDGDEEHGPHSVILTQDKKSFYIIAGNSTRVPPMDAYRVPPVWKDDNLIPLVADPSGGDRNQKIPGGWIAKVDSTGTHWELVSTGLRNSFDLAINEAGDLFTYDSDMEWDIGMPWYRPTRICHVTSGSEFGWRSGSGKFSTDYLDNLPPVLNIGQGSPTNLISAQGSKFPNKYRHSLFAFDWSFGIVYAIHLHPEGSSYRAQAEEFISGAPLPLTDGVIGPDGALYFLTGGRRLDSDLYRVYYSDSSINHIVFASDKFAELNEPSKIRRQLELYHGKRDKKANGYAWPYLKSNDRFIRYAARIAIEHQPVSQWRERALSEKDPQILIAAIVALARNGDPNLGSRILKALMTINFKQLSASYQIDFLRALELTLSRMGKPKPSLKKNLITYLNPHYPATTNQLNRMFAKLLVYLEAPLVIEKTLALIDIAKDDDAQHSVTRSSDLIFRNPQYGMDLAGALAKTPPAQQIYYAFVLSEAKTGWTTELRDKYFKWFYNAYSFKGGRSYVNFINKARKTALAYVPNDQFKHYDTISINTSTENSVIDWVKITFSGGPGKNWKMEDALPLFQDGLTKRDFKQGKMLFSATACISCHGMQGEGGSIGPDLTQLGTRFSPRDILESIIEPNKVISDQYAATVFYLKNGKSLIGRLIKEDEYTYFVSQNPFSPETLLELSKQDVSKTRTSDVSIMPPGLINSLNAEKLKDLMAFLIAGGNKEHLVYEAKGQ